MIGPGETLDSLPFLGSPDVHIRHQWPPDFTPPREGHWVMIQPWEYGSMPSSWVEPMTRLLDEVWVPSNFVKDCYVRGGVPEACVHVIPNGVGPEMVSSGKNRFPLRTTKKFKFLFVGGTLRRKGIDLLLQAYRQTFTRADDVCLVVKDMGSRTFYQGKTAHQQIAEIQADPGAPEIEYLDEELTEAQIADLYASCDCLVHPFRGEGFALPVAEAMANGVPAIVTGYGPVRDYCNDENAFFIPATLTRFDEKRVGTLETVDHPFLAVPDVRVLGSLMRHVVANVDEANAKGKCAQKTILQSFTWANAVQAIENRLQEILRKPIRRHHLRDQ